MDYSGGFVFDEAYLSIVSTVIDRVFKFIDCCAAIFILCFGCAIYLAYKKKITLKHSYKKILSSLGVSAAGAILCGLVSPASETIMEIESFKMDPKIFLKELVALNFDIKYFIIVSITVCAGVFLLIGVFNYRYIFHIMKYQVFAMAIKAVLLYYASVHINPDFRTLPRVFWNICIVLITIIIFLILLPENSALNREKDLMLYSVFLVAYIAVTITLNEMMKNNFSILSFVILILYVAFLCMVPVLILKTVCNQNIFNRAKAKERSTVKSTVSYLERNEEFSKYLHDLPKHLKIIESMASGSSEEDIAHYARELTENYYKSKNKFMSGNIRLDEILKLKTAETKKHNAEIVFSGIFPEYVKVKQDHLTDIFSNAVDVALKSCKGHSEQCKIRINSQLEGENTVIVTVSCPSSRAKRKRDELSAIFMTFNESRIRIIDRIVRRYKGTSTLRFDDDTMKLIFSLKYK